MSGRQLPCKFWFLNRVSLQLGEPPKLFCLACYAGIPVPAGRRTSSNFTGTGWAGALRVRGKLRLYPQLDK